MTEFTDEELTHIYDRTAIGDCELCKSIREKTQTHLICHETICNGEPVGIGSYEKQKIESDAKQQLLELYRNLATVRIAQGISGLTYKSMLAYLSKSPEEITAEINGVCKNSGYPLEKLKELVRSQTELETLQKGNYK